MKLFIVGGTSGIGLALAHYYSELGWEVGVCGRNIEKINTENRFQKYQLDVIDRDKLFEALKDFSRDAPLDMLINCSGSYAEDVAGKISYEEAIAMLQTNILGTTNVLEAGREFMKNQDKGKIILIASASAVLDYPKSSLYTKTKRSIVQIADAYRRALSPFGIVITVLAPGYVDTEKLRRLNEDNLSKKPFLISEKEAVLEIVNAINRNEEFYIFPKKMKYLMNALALLPSFLLNKIMYKKAKWMKEN